MLRLQRSVLLQQEVPEDYVIATGITTKVRDFIDMAFSEVGMKLRWEGEGVDEVGVLKSLDEKKYKLATGLEFGADSTLNLQTLTLDTPIVRIDPRYFRPTEVDLLLGDPTKAKTKLGWKPKYDLPMLVAEMMQSDLSLFKKDIELQKAGHIVYRQEE